MYKWDGLPPDPKVCGWHWLNFHDSPLVAFWWPSDQTWELQMGDRLPPDKMAPEYHYVRSCPWPLELEKFEGAMREATDVIGKMTVDLARATANLSLSERKVEVWRGMPTQLQHSLRNLRQELTGVMNSRAWDAESKARFQGGIMILEEIDKTLTGIVQEVGSFLDRVGRV